MTNTRDQELTYLIPGLQQIWYKSNLIIERASGCTLWDDHGKRYLDLWAGGGVCSIGHSHPQYIEQVVKQLKHGVVGSYASRIRGEYLEQLATIAPAGLSRIQLYTSGTEAIEAALRLAKSYTRRSGFLSFNGSFHGKTLGALSLGDWQDRHAYTPYPPGFHRAPYCTYGVSGGDQKQVVCEDECILSRSLEEFCSEAADRLAAIVVEPVQGSAGNLYPCEHFLPLMRRLADITGALLIFDEIITGFGRTGSMFVSERCGVIPDIIVLGKGMGNGIPISGLIATENIATSLPFSGPSGSSTSYGGNPLSAAAGLATLRALQEEQLVATSNAIGKHLVAELRERLAVNPVVEAVWGEGLLIGLRLIDPHGGSPLSSSECDGIFRSVLEGGVLAALYTSNVRINPPLSMNEAEASYAVRVLVGVLNDFARHYV